MNFLSCKTLSVLCLIYDCGLILFERWFSIPANIYFAIVATIVWIVDSNWTFCTWFLTCPFWFELSCKTLSDLCLIYDCGLILFERWFSIPANIYFAIVATIVWIVDSNWTFCTWFLTCPFWFELSCKTLSDLCLIYDCGLVVCSFSNSMFWTLTLSRKQNNSALPFLRNKTIARNQNTVKAILFPLQLLVLKVF